MALQLLNSISTEWVYIYVKTSVHRLFNRESGDNVDVKNKNERQKGQDENQHDSQINHLSQ